MKLLLTSAGVRNASIRQALVELMGKPISDAEFTGPPSHSMMLGRPIPRSPSALTDPDSA